MFTRYDIDADVTPRNVGNAAAVFRQPFVNDLLSLLPGSKFSNLTGDDTPVNFQNVIDGLARISLGTSNIINDVKGKQRLGAYRNPIIPQRAYGYPDDGYDYYDNDRILGINKVVFFILAGLLIWAFMSQGHKR
ncbi:hypothetical protein DYU05_03965 [Mucilaginibacter terrenus]|uniref:Uncharacterized protein n=1 Tax=Mucilaginibacter terrenus TaxID=2482727 RepID=A0A3E2NV31_9SPHI|nr:hypothetical protein [Mucilaginibacter terrenus]RFZ84771.1 hypothetical protein DYU05_03965 [Mucilaginibacter terrenus]